MEPRIVIESATGRLHQIITSKCKLYKIKTPTNVEVKAQNNRKVEHYEKDCKAHIYFGCRHVIYPISKSYLHALEKIVRGPTNFIRFRGIPES